MTQANTEGSSYVAEATHFENAFGTVTDRRVVYYRKKGWFSGGSREDVPLKHVTSVRVDISRKVLGGLVLVVMGLVLLAPVIGIIPLFVGILWLWGSPQVVISTAGANQEIMTALPWQRKGAEAFAHAVRQQLFKN